MKNETKKSVLSSKALETIKAHIGTSNSGGGNSNIFNYLMSLSLKERQVGLSAKAIADGIAKTSGVILTDKQVRNYFRTIFSVGKDKGENSKYSGIGESVIQGDTYIAYATQHSQPMLYSLVSETETQGAKK